MNTTAFTAEELLRSFVPTEHTNGVEIIGKTLYAGLNQENILKVSLMNSTGLGCTGITLTVINKQHGQLDVNIIPFPSYITENDCSARKSLYACVMPLGTYRWEEPLLTQEKESIRQQVDAYIQMFQ